MMSKGGMQHHAATLSPTGIEERTHHHAEDSNFTRVARKVETGTRRALINVWRPQVERRESLKRTDNHQAKARQQQRLTSIPSPRK